MSKRNQSQGIRRGGEISCFDPSSMTLLKSRPKYKEIFRKVGCLRFCQKLGGHHVDVSYRFSLGYDWKSSKIGNLVIPATAKDISLVTGIPEEGEKWFKSTFLDLD